MQASLTDITKEELKKVLDGLLPNRDQAPSIIFVSGGSGTGKTYLIDKMEEAFSDKHLMYIRFDQIGVPPSEEMIREYGSGSNWQRASTVEWVRRMKEDYADKSLFIFEGSYRLNFALEACKQYGIENFRLVVLTVPDEIMAKRLTESRGQPELVNDDMRNWLRFLREQGESHNALIIDTSEETISHTVDSLLGEALKLMHNVV